MLVTIGRERLDVVLGMAVVPGDVDVEVDAEVDIEVDVELEVDVDVGSSEHPPSSVGKPGMQKGGVTALLLVDVLLDGTLLVGAEVVVSDAPEREEDVCVGEVVLVDVGVDEFAVVLEIGQPPRSTGKPGMQKMGALADADELVVDEDRVEVEVLVGQPPRPIGRPGMHGRCVVTLVEVVFAEEEGGELEQQHFTRQLCLSRMVAITTVLTRMSSKRSWMSRIRQGRPEAPKCTEARCPRQYASVLARKEVKASELTPKWL